MEAIQRSNSQTQQEGKEIRREGWEGYGAGELEAVQGEHEYYGRKQEVEEESYPPTPREPHLDVRVDSEEIFSLRTSLRYSLPSPEP
ncbi:hypothetical protein RHSIM_Rhsim11G0051400 [Rhododendron simsii]|uniref:Uncharacterized protein n=1 Tax=Rhododendron simsii TaxID=118357 RepID=A0A834G8N6_RHOSS|nr:hypothetical protein RHSIM_Rhsim11G0051400 [Rhododendron simsii]